MEQTIAIAVAFALVIAAATALAPRLRLPSPLLLVLLGIAATLLPFVPEVELQPELVLLAILPPLLFSASVSLPAMDLRREFGAVSGLSVLLVLLTALVLGSVFTLVVPGLGFGWGVALGAVISPTDAVATSIVKRTGVSSRVTAILEGESLLNDASALVLLRTAVLAAGAAGATLSVPGVIGDFAYSVLVAVVIGVVVSRIGIAVRRRVTDTAAGTLLSFALPYLASLPAEALGASGLVAAVAAGLVVGRRSARVSSPQQRLSDQQNWRTAALALEGAVFLLMGLQVRSILDRANETAGAAVGWTALAVGALAVAVTVLVRTAFVAPLLGWLHLRSRRGQRMRDQVERMHSAGVGDDPFAERRRRGRARPLRRSGEVDRFQRRVRQLLADIDHLAARPLGPREGAVVVWAGMRGAVTVAAAQTLPGEAGGGQQPLLVLIAFAAATLSLIVQGSTLAIVIRVLRPRSDDPAMLAEEHREVLALLTRTADDVPAEEGRSAKQHRLQQLRAQRQALLDARDDGALDAAVLGGALEAVDSAQITLELTGGPDG